MTALSSYLKTVYASTVFRATAGLVIVFVTLAAVLSALVYWQTNRVLTRQLAESLSAEARVLSSIARQDGLQALAEALRTRARNDRLGLYLLEADNGHQLAGNLSRFPPEIAAVNQGGVFTYSSGGDAGRRLAVGLPVDLGGARMIVGRDVEEQRVLVQSFRTTALIGFALLALCGLIGALAISRIVLGRVEEIREASQSIISGNLSERVPVAGTGDELDDLAHSLNEMLERIELLMTGLREVSDNIAHDLKTPLNRLRNRAEAALREPDRHEAGLRETIEAADDIIKTFNALLLIARLEAGALDESGDQVDVSGLVRDIAELYEPVAEEAGLQLSLTDTADGPLFVRGNRQLLGQAVANLIDNAIKYSKAGASGARGGQPGTSDAAPSALAGGEGSTREVAAVEAVAGRDQIGALDLPGAVSDKRDPAAGHGAAEAFEAASCNGSGSARSVTVEVSGGHDGSPLKIRVCDHGPGISPEDRERVLKRFVRLDASRSAPGTGLGLSLVTAVARMHGGRLRLDDNAPGLCAELVLPPAMA